MLEFLLQQFKTNQFLTAGVATVITGSILYFLKSIPQIIYLNLRRYFTLEFTILSDNSAFQDVLEVLQKHRLEFFSRNFSISPHNNRVTPGYGISFSFFDGRFFISERSIMEQKNQIYEKLVITILSRNKGKIKKLIESAINKTGSNVIIVKPSVSTYWGEPFTITKRSLESVFVNNEIKNLIIDKIKWFYNNESWYVKHGVPYKLNILLYGVPGTGKTSLSKAIIGYFNKNLRYVSHISCYSSLISEIDPENDIILIEDIDRLLNIEEKNKRDKFDVLEEETPSQGKTFHQFINSLDGIHTLHGTVNIFTANDISKIDNTILRKGRIDLIQEIGLLNEKSIKDMFESFYGIQLPLDNLKPMKGSDLQDIIIQNSVEEAIKELEKCQTPEI